MRILHFTLAVAILITAQILSAQEAEMDTSRARDKKWGFAAALFDRTSGEIAISKNLSRRTMILLSGAVRWTDVDQDESSDQPPNFARTFAESSQRNFSIDLGPELRRYSPRNTNLAFYVGFRPFVGYGRTSLDGKYTQFDTLVTVSEYKRTTKFLGFNLSCGVEYRLLDRLSLSVHLRPFDYAYSKYTDESHRAQSGASPYNRSATTKQHSVNFVQVAGIFVRVYF